MKELFVQVGIKNTLPRRRILEILDAAEQPLTAHQIADQLSGEIDLSTVYRTLDLFTEKQLVVKTVSFGDATAGYERNSGEHRHMLICTECGETAYFRACPIHALEKQLESETGYEIKTHRLELTGLCGSCRKK
ncbi:MAG: Fur family transcriptional regulator [Bacillota bacterium]|nr:Fur family transcriptional regulator [Bacillota bacterium]